MLLRIATGALLAILGGMGLFWARPAEKSTLLGDACHTPARILGPSSASAPVAVVFHGFAASAGMMEPLGESLAESGWRVYLLELAGHGRSVERFSYVRVDRCARDAVEFLARSKLLVPSQTVFIGHSLGGAVAIHLGRAFPAAATVAISPALLVPKKPTPSNLLILAGQLDLGPVKQTAWQLLEAAGGTRDESADFARGRAAALVIVSGELHGTMVLDPRTWRLVLRWASLAIGRGTRAGGLAGVSAGAIDMPLAALLSDFALLAGMALLVAPTLTLLARILHLTSSAGSVTPAFRPAGADLNLPPPSQIVIPKTSSPVSAPASQDRAEIGRIGEDEESLPAGARRARAQAGRSRNGGNLGPQQNRSGVHADRTTHGRVPFSWKGALGAWAAAAFIAVSGVGLSRLAQFAKPVKLENGDWTAWVALLTGVFLLILLGKAAKQKLHADSRGLAVAAVAGVLLVVLFAWAARPELVDSALSAARIWRWAVLAVFTIPYFWAEETALGPPAERNRAGLADTLFPASLPTCHLEARTARFPRLPLKTPRKSGELARDEESLPARGASAQDVNGANRFLLFLAMRGLIWLAQAFALEIFWPSGLLLVLLAIGLGIVSIGQRLAADALRRRGLGVPAVALFDAILAAGALALVLPLI